MSPRHALLFAACGFEANDVCQGVGGALGVSQGARVPFLGSGGKLLARASGGVLSRFVDASLFCWLWVWCYVRGGGLADTSKTPMTSGRGITAMKQENPVLLRSM